MAQADEGTAPAADVAKSVAPAAEAEGAARRPGPRCWWSLCKSELYNLRQLLTCLTAGVEVPPGMFTAVSLSESHCRQMDPHALRRLLEKQASVVAGRLAESHPCVNQVPGGCPSPATCELRDLPSYTCRRFLEGKCARTAAECPYEHVSPTKDFLPAHLRTQYRKPDEGRQGCQFPRPHAFDRQEWPGGKGATASAGVAGGDPKLRPRGPYTALPVVPAPEPGGAEWGPAAGGWEPPGGYGPPQPYPALAPPAHAPWGPGCPPSSYAAPPAQYPPLMGPPGFPAAAYPSPADGLPGHFQPSPGAAPAAGQVPAGLTCSLEKWQTNYAKFLEDLKLDLLDSILQLSV